VKKKSEKTRPFHNSLIFAIRGAVLPVRSSIINLCQQTTSTKEKIVMEVYFLLLVLSVVVRNARV
jgi:hypothetical protein